MPSGRRGLRRRPQPLPAGNRHVRRLGRRRRPEGEPADLPHTLPTFKTESPNLPRYTRALPVTKNTTLPRATTVLALRPRDLPDNASLKAWALEPDGTVERLLWLNNYRQSWTRSYILQTPLALPAGTRLRVSAPAGSLLVYCR